VADAAGERGHTGVVDGVGCDVDVGAVGCELLAVGRRVDGRHVRAAARDLYADGGHGHSHGCGADGDGGGAGEGGEEGGWFLHRGRVLG